MFSSCGYPSHHAHFYRDSRPVVATSPFAYDDYDTFRSRYELQQLAARQQQRRELEQRELARRRRQLLVEQEVRRRMAIEQEVQKQLAIEQARREYEIEITKRAAHEAGRRRHRRQQAIESFIRHLLEDFCSDATPPPSDSESKQVGNHPDESSIQSADPSSPTEAASSAPAPTTDARPSAVDEAAAATLQRRYRAHLHRREQVAKLASLTSTLESTTAAFTIPESLVFTQDSNKLAYSPANAPFLAHEEFLVGLLSKVDEISSNGDRVIKQARKDLVRRVEAELIKLDEKKESELEKHKARGEGKGKEKEVVEEDDDTASLPDLLEPSATATFNAHDNNGKTTRLTSEALATVPAPDAPPRHPAASEAGSTASRTISTLGDIDVDEAVAKVLEAAGKLEEHVMALEETEQKMQPEETREEPQESSEAPRTLESAPAPVTEAFTKALEEEGFIVV